MPISSLKQTSETPSSPSAPAWMYEGPGGTSWPLVQLSEVDSMILFPASGLPVYQTASGQLWPTPTEPSPIVTWQPRYPRWTRLRRWIGRSLISLGRRLSQ